MLDTVTALFGVISVGIFVAHAVDGQLVRIKVGGGRVKAEHDDVAAAARRTGTPLRELASVAEVTWMAEHGRDAGPSTAAPGTVPIRPGAELGGEGNCDEDDSSDDPA